MKSTRPLFNIFVITIAFGCLSAASFGDEVPATWLRAPEGFKVTRFADDSLATNIYSMTTDRLGRVVVSGPGYIKILLDEDGDGKAEEAKLFAELPKNGAQGLCFDGTDLLCIGDAGVLRFKDENRDDRADGPPEVLWKIRTGGEHDSHALRKGPDGWWYLASGNYSQIQSKIVTSSHSPVANPEGGVISRLSPDFRSREVLMDGLRNAYDFDFDSRGDLFVYDSDGERDVSLPWYRPTRVFRMHPGSHAGWVSRSWKRPGYLIDMPTVAARLGRGSPTGVVTYRHWQFPAEYQDSVFVLDWTFGRVVAVSRTGEENAFAHRLFLSGKGTHGFAPTDACVGVDGSLYISVGGRSTQGSVYRIRFENSKYAGVRVEPPRTVEDCLDLPQPLSAWSRGLWENGAQRFGKDDFMEALFNESLSRQLRIRAVEIITDIFSGMNVDEQEKASQIPDPRIQARLAWSICNRPISQIKPSVLFHFANHPDAIVRIAAWQALAGTKNLPSFLAKPVAKDLSSTNLLLKKAAVFLVASSGFAPTGFLKPESPNRDNIAEPIGLSLRKNAFRPEVWKQGWNKLLASSSPTKQLDLIRLLQLALGDVGPQKGLPQVFEGYTPLGTSQSDLLDANQLSFLERLSTETEGALQRESIRLLAMGRTEGQKTVDRLLSTVTDTTDVAFDLHVLIAVAAIYLPQTVGAEAKVPSKNSPSPGTRRLAEIVIDLQAKIDRQDLNQDRNWVPRVREVLKVLQLHEPKLGSLIAERGLHSPQQIFLLDFIPPADKSDAIDQLFKHLRKREDYVIDGNLIRLLGSTGRADHLKAVRESASIPSALDAVIEILARNPVPDDRPVFVRGLKSTQADTVKRSAFALARLPKSEAAPEQFALFNAIRKLSVDKVGFVAREPVVRQLQRNLGRSFGFEYGKKGHKPQADVIRQWRSHLTKKFPDQISLLASNRGFNQKQFMDELAEVDWEAGEIENGERLFEELSCAKCHGKSSRLGPDLAGVAKRFSREDLFRSIADPDDQIPSRYQATLFETIDGKVFSGIIIYESVDGVLIRNSDNQTVRIEQDEILQRQKGAKSMMPEGLLQDRSPEDFADLYEYLKSL